MAKKSSIYIPDRLDAVLGPCGETTGMSLSGRIAAIVDRYGEIIRRHRPQLTRAEWMLLMDALNGWASWAEAGRTLMIGIALEVEDAIAMHRLDAKWGLAPQQAQELVRRLRELSFAEAISVIDAAEMFWAHADLDADAALAKAGVRPSDAPRA